MISTDEILDLEVERDMDIEGECVSAEDMTAQMVSLQSQLDQLRLKAIKARACLESLDPLYKPDQFYSKEMSAERLNTLTQGRTRAFLNYCTLQDALRGSEAVKALKAGLELLDDKDKADSSHINETEDIRLEPEERTYVLELMNEEKQLSKEFADKSNWCNQQEIQIIQMRKDVAENLCKISDLWGKITDSESKVSVKATDKELQERLKHEEAKLNQMRLMLQRLMIGEKKLAQIFDPKTNEKFKEMFYICGMKPDELREENLDLTSPVS